MVEEAAVQRFSQENVWSYKQPTANKMSSTSELQQYGDCAGHTIDNHIVLRALYKLSQTVKREDLPMLDILISFILLLSFGTKWGY